MSVSARKPRSRKVPKTFRLVPEKLVAARKALGVATETEAIEIALDLVLFRKELLRGTDAMFGTRLDSPDEDE